jgi:hypothetical protein
MNRVFDFGHSPLPLCPKTKTKKLIYQFYKANLKKESVPQPQKFFESREKIKFSLQSGQTT